MRDPYFTKQDVEIEKLRLDLEDETEDCMKNAIQAILSMLYELTKQKTQKLFKVPTDNPNDIIVGLHKQGVISNETLATVRDGQAKCDGCSDCTCNEKPKLRTAENTDGYETIKESDDCGKKPLKDLTDEEKNTLKELGLFWELYPEADE